MLSESCGSNSTQTLQIMSDVFKLLDRLVEIDNFEAQREIANELKTELGRILKELSDVKGKNIEILESIFQYQIESEKENDSEH